MSIPENQELLILKIIDKDVEAFEKLYDCFAPSMFNVIYKMVNCIPTSEDILQNVFIKVWSKINKYDKDRGRLFTWLLNITRNETLDHLRSKYARQQKLRTYNAEPLEYQHRVSVQAHRVDITKLLYLVAPMERSILLLITMGYTNKQVSEIVNLPLGTVKGKLRSSYKKLRRLFVQDFH